MGAHTIAKLETDARSIFDSLRRIVQLLRLFDHEAQKQSRLSGAQLFVLRQLGAQRSISINELSGRTHTDQSSVSVVVQKLIARGLIRKIKDPHDARRVQLALTRAGTTLLKTAPPAAQDRLISAIAAFPVTRRRQLGNLLAELIRETGIHSQAPKLFFEDRTLTQKQRRISK